MSALLDVNLLLACGWKTHAEHEQALTGYALTVLYMMGPIGTLIGIVPSFNSAMVSLRKLEEMGFALSDLEGKRYFIEHGQPGRSQC